MSVNDLISRRQQQDEKTETVTVRLSPYYLGIIDDLSASLDVTRQTLLTEIIKDGVEGALDLYNNTQNTPNNELEDESNAKGPRFFVLNTNKRYDEDTHVDMVTNGVAAAFNDPWKFQIDRIKKGDVVFLYENGVGIVGTGIGTAVVEKAEYDGNPEGAYRKKLNNYSRVHPLNARDIKKIVGSNLVFLRTLFTIPMAFGKKIQDHLEPL